MKIGSSNVLGAIYQAVEKPEFFYVVNTDTMLKIGSQWAYSPGVGGFSMHAPKSRDFIVSLNFVSGGVPFLSSSAVTRASLHGTAMMAETGCNSLVASTSSP